MLKYLYFCLLSSALVSLAACSSMSSLASITRPADDQLVAVEDPSSLPEIAPRGANFRTLSTAVSEDDPDYMGALSSNRFDPKSTSNKYGVYGSPYSPKSINNPYAAKGNTGAYGTSGTSPYLVSSDGKFLGNVNSNKYDPNSISNPYGRYGSKFSPDSVNNPYGTYGSKFSDQSPNNPYATSAPSIFSPY